MRPRKIAETSSVRNLRPFGIQVEGVDLVLIRNDDDVSVLYGRCLHRGALMQVLARACGHDALSKFQPEDLSTFDRSVSELTGIRFAGR